MNCPRCAGLIHDFDAKFCPECGFRLADAKKASCPQCSKEIKDENNKFCSECGYRLCSTIHNDRKVEYIASVTSRDASATAQPPTNNSQRILRALGIALIVIGIGMGIVAIVIPVNMDGWDFAYGGGRETTIAIAVIAGIALVLGIALLIAAGNASKTKKHRREDTAQIATTGFCEECGAESDCLTKHGGRLLCDVCGHNMCTYNADANCEICGVRSEQLVRRLVWTDICPSCAKKYEQ